MNVSEIMTCSPIAVSPEHTLLYARDLMLSNDARHLPVTDEERLLGIISARDITAHQARTGESLASSPNDTVAMAMNSPVVTVSPLDSVTLAAQRMAEQKIGCLPVVVEECMVGIVTTTDVMAAQAGEHRSLSDSARSVMSSNPVVTRAGDRLLDAAAKMQKLRVRHLPVVDGDSVVIGMLSDRDLRTALGNPRGALASGNGANLLVSSVMSSPAITANADDSCATLARHFVEQNVSCLPIVDAERRLVGVVSYVDILKNVLESQ